MTKPILNKLSVINYDRHWGPYGQYVDWITESEYTSEKSLTKEEFDKIVSENHSIAGSLKYTKRKLTYSDGSVYYKHILEEKMY